MRRFVIVQAATLFSFCLAWDPSDRYPGPNYRLYEDDENIHSPGKIENKLVLAENFTQFLLKNKQNSEKPDNPYAADIVSKLEENFDNSKLATETDMLNFSTRKYDIAEYESNLIRFSTKKTQIPFRYTVVPNMNLFKTDAPATRDRKEVFQVLKLLEEAEPHNTPTVIRKFAQIENDFNFETNNQILNENSEFGIDSNDDVFTLKKVIKIDPPEALQIIKHTTTAGIASIITTKSFILNELLKITTKTSKTNDTIKNETKSTSVQEAFNNTKFICIEANNSDNKQENLNPNKKPLSSNRRDIKTSIEDDDDRILKFETILNRETEIIDILKRQTSLLEQVAKFLDAKEKEKEVMRSVASFKDFENILSEVNKKKQMLDKGTNMTQKAVDTVKKKIKLMSEQVTKTEKQLATVVTTKQRILPTERTVIDETEVRNALKNDPYVKRILKMARRKRTRYLKDALM